MVKMSRRLAAAFTVLALLAAGAAPLHALAVAAVPGADLCVASGDRESGSGTPAGNGGHACERCAACTGGGAALPPAAGAGPVAHATATASAPRIPVTAASTAPAAPLARGPPRSAGSPPPAA